MKPGIPKPGGGGLLRKAVLNQAVESEKSELGGTSTNVAEDIANSASHSSSAVGNSLYGAIPEDGPVDSAGLEATAVAPSPVPAATHAPRSHSMGRAPEKYTPIAWDAYFDESKDIPIPGTKNVFHVHTGGTEGPVIYCIHGGGYSGLSFALAAQKMKANVRVVAVDMRGHGQTRTENDSDLSAETLCKDMLDVIEAMYGQEPPAIVLVGHSMGGAIAVRTAAMRALPTLAGLVVIDVVEGTAMASLQFMQSVLGNRPNHFPTLEKAIEWSYRNGSVRNLESARVSVPSTLRPDESGRYTWIANLGESEEHWRGWYEGLSDTFNSCPVPKLLLLAGTDRLDRPLTIAQMQGKFQMTVFRHAGHAIQEDEPEQFSDAIVHFLAHNRIGSQGLLIPGLRRPVSLRSPSSPT